MPTRSISRAAATRRDDRLTQSIAGLFLLSLCVALAGCGATYGGNLTQSEASIPSPPRSALPLAEAAASLADATLGRAQLPPTGTSARYRLVIDPLIDRATGAETAATREMEGQISTLIRERHPRYELRPFTSQSLDERPLVLLGAITGVTAAGSLTNAGPGSPSVYRIWAVLADLSSGRVIAHETAWVSADTVDPIPTAFFRDSPGLTVDDAAAAYLRTCALNPGDPIDPAYLRTIRTQALVADGIRAYEAKRYDEALGFYADARGRAPVEQQLRIRNGLYLAYQALGRQQEAEAAFADVVDYGLDRGRLGVKFVFQPGSTGFWRDPAISGPYTMWLRQIAIRTAARPICLNVEGHSSPTGPAALNERLSLMRAQRILGRLIAEQPALRGRLAAEGAGASQLIVGNGRDDASDLPDRRVEFDPLSCTLVTARM